MTSLVMGSSLLSLREELAGSWPHRGLSPLAPGSAVTAASALEGRDCSEKSEDNARTRYLLETDRPLTSDLVSLPVNL